MSVEERKEAETRDADFDRATAEMCRFLPGDEKFLLLSFFLSRFGRAALLCVSSPHRWKHRDRNLVDDSANRADEPERNRIIPRGAATFHKHRDARHAKTYIPLESAACAKRCSPVHPLAHFRFIILHERSSFRNLIHG